MTILKANQQLSTNERAHSIALTMLMLVQSALGLLIPGAYRDVRWIRAAWFGNDLVTLFVVVPILIAALAFMRRGSQRARLVWLGTLGYGAYNYAFYLLGAALNAFFPIYILAFVTAVAALIIGLVQSDVHALAEGFSDRAPVRAIGCYYVFVAVGLSVVWLGMWAAYIYAGRSIPVGTEVFKLVAALDTTIMVPALAVGGVLLSSRRSWGYVVSAAAGIQASLYLLVLTVNSAVAIIRGLVEAPGELPVWGALLLPTAAVTVLLLLASGRKNGNAVGM